MTPPNKSQLDLKSIATVMVGVADVAEQDLGLARDAKFIERAAFVRLGLFSLVVMGEIKKGKSSFINALCGIGPLVPVHAEIATSTIFKIRYGPRTKYTVYFQEKEGEPQRSEEIPTEALNEYGTEMGNPGNIKQVDFIAVEAPSPLLSAGLIIVDTPGVGGLFKHHRDITFRHAPRAHGIFFVTDSVESPIGADEVAFLKELRRITGKIYFVQTKAEKVDEKSAQARMKNNISILTEQVGFTEAELRYFIVSSALKLEGDLAKSMDDLEDSGFIPLMRFLNVELKEGLNRTIGSEALSLTRTKLHSLLPEITWRRKVLDANSTEKRAALEKDLRELNDRLRQWQTDELPALKRDFNQALSQTVQHAQNELNLALRPGGTISDVAASKLDGMYSAETIYASVAALFNDTRAAASFQLIDTCHDLEAGLKTLVSTLEGKVRAQVADYFEGGQAADRIKGDAVDDLDLSSRRAIANLEKKAHEGSHFERARNAFVGGSSAVGMGALVIAVATAIFPGIGTLVASAGVGLVASLGAAGALTVDRTRARREAEAARREVRGELDREMGHLQGQANARLAKLHSTLAGQAGDALQGIVTSVSRTLEQRKTQLDQRGRETTEQLAALYKWQQALEAKAGQLMTQVDALEPLTRA